MTVWDFEIWVIRVEVWLFIAWVLEQVFKTDPYEEQDHDAKH